MENTVEMSLVFQSVMSLVCQSVMGLVCQSVTCLTPGTLSHHMVKLTWQSETA